MIFRSRRVVLPDGVRPADVHVERGRIARIDDGDARLKPSRSDGELLIDFSDLVISPGLVDTHVHVNEPGRTEWEGFDTATRAAAAGGVTTIVDMPLNSVPATTDAEGLEAKRSAARGRVHVDVAFWGGVIPGNAGELDGLADAGVRGFKCFLVPSGVDEFPHVTERDLREALPILARRRVPLLVHAELPEFLGSPERLTLVDDSPGARGCEPSVYATYLATRPPRAELEAVEVMIRLAREFDARVHIVHVACAEAVAAIARAKADGVPITAETCPHYLTFTAAEVGDGATEFKCAPPIRDASHRDALWAGLHSGALDLVATDHSPSPPAMKRGGDFMTAWGGIASLELSLAAVWTAYSDVGPAFQAGHCGPPDRVLLREVSRWMSAAPAALARLDDRKGDIAVGRDADLVIWDSDATWTVDSPRLQQRHPLTPYAGRTLRGLVRETYVRGQRVWNDGALDRPAAGMLL
jgi:allantoinase